MDPDATKPASSTARRDMNAVVPEKRDSNALRASVLDAVLQLGIANNATVADWIFNNPVDEEDETEVLTSPCLTSHSTTTSEDLVPDSPAQSYQIQGAGAGPPQAGFPHTPIIVSPEQDSSLLVQSSTIPLDLYQFENPMPQPVTSGQKLKKLRKTRKAGDGYSSDGGYLSDVRVKRTEKDEKKGGNEKELEKVRKKQEKKEEEQRRKEKKEEKRRRKKKEKLGMTNSDGDDQPGQTTDYDTDRGYLSEASSKQKTKSKFKFKATIAGSPPLPDPSHGSDSRSPTKPKKGFFRMRSKSRANSLEEPEPEVIPPLPTFPHPIAAKFARTLVDDSANSVSTHSADSSLNADAVPLLTHPVSSYASRSSESIRSSNTFKHVNNEEVPQNSPSLSSFSHIIQGVVASKSSSDNLSSPGSIGGSLSLPVPSASAQGRSLSPSRSSPLLGKLSINTSLNFFGTQSSSAKKQAASPLTPLSLRSGPESPFVAQSKLTPNVNGASNLGASLPSPYILVTPTFSDDQVATTNELKHHPPATAPSGSAPLSPLPSPRFFLSHYDMPPPSPPPTGPLPQPPPVSFDANSRAVSPLSVTSSTTYSNNHAHPVTRSVSPMQRGRESPFPTRPARPVPLRPGKFSELEAKLKTDRYRDLYGLKAIGGTGTTFPRTVGGVQVLVPAPGISIEYLSEEEDDKENDVSALMEPTERTGTWSGAVSTTTSAEKETIGLLSDSTGKRTHPAEDFSDSTGEHSEDATHYSDDDKSYYPDEDESYSQRSHIDDDKSHYPDDEKSLYPNDDRLTLYSMTDEDRGEGSRYSQFAPSVYSQVSLLDGEKSVEARERFVRRVQAMFSGGERNDPDAIPPVPKLPGRFEGMNNLSLNRNRPGQMGGGKF